MKDRMKVVRLVMKTDDSLDLLKVEMLDFWMVSLWVLKMVQRLEFLLGRRSEKHLGL